VPLIIAGPGIKAGTIVQEQVCHLDLAPTIADFAKIESPPDFHGKSLLPIASGAKSPQTAVISTILTSPAGEEPLENLRQGPEHLLGSKAGQRLLAYRTPSWKYIRTEATDASEATLAEELYYLQNDPRENNNLHGASIEEAKRFESEAKGKLLQFKELKIKEKTKHEKERVKSRLKKLGKL
jgi:arylsulfatase A-like enzyme